MTNLPRSCSQVLGVGLEYNFSEDTVQCTTWVLNNNNNNNKRPLCPARSEMGTHRWEDKVAEGELLAEGLPVCGRPAGGLRPRHPPGGTKRHRVCLNRDQLTSGLRLEEGSCIFYVKVPAGQCPGCDSCETQGSSSVWPRCPWDAALSRGPPSSSSWLPGEGGSSFLLRSDPHLLLFLLLSSGLLQSSGSLWTRRGQEPRRVQTPHAQAVKTFSGAGRDYWELMLPP